MNDLVLLDTHVVLWIMLEPEKIPEAIKQHIKIALENKLLFFSSISLWEIAMLAHKKRININQPIKDFLQSITNIKGLSIKNISVEVAAESSLLINDFHNDPADRLIVATAKCYNATLITRDQKILTWAKFGHIKSLKV
ncbi:type II toxin-antitoxin system VapC family toxin [Rickettsia endosymbiont of Orchestes rusci]|uniref:type II toxin-antitoxin system VapC family toxin n=1 Tax=Rickettsia endosymbiont of Orchestes rusci TaxID=3066250 RepID=UPI00313CA1D6